MKEGERVGGKEAKGGQGTRAASVTTTHMPLSQYFLLHSTTVNMKTQRVLFHAQQSYAISNVYFSSTPTAGNNLISKFLLLHSPFLQASNQLYKMRLSKAREVTKYMYEMYT